MRLYVHMTDSLPYIGRNQNRSFLLHPPHNWDKILKYTSRLHPELGDFFVLFWWHSTLICWRNHRSNIRCEPLQNIHTKKSIGNIRKTRGNPELLARVNFSNYFKAVTWWFRLKSQAGRYVWLSSVLSPTSWRLILFIIYSFNCGAVRLTFLLD